MLRTQLLPPSKVFLLRELAVWLNVVAKRDLIRPVHFWGCHGGVNKRRWHELFVGFVS